MTDEQMFDEFYAIIPKYAQRSQKKISRALFEAITGPGLHVKVDGLAMFHKEIPQVLIQAAKACRMSMIETAEPGEHEFKYAPACQVWLRRGRWEDIDDDERYRLAAKYDDLQERVNSNLRVVK